MIQYKNEHITVFQSCLYQTTTTVVETKEFILLVDPNWLPHEIEEIQQYVNRMKRNRELYLLFTHGDFDHVIGYRAFPNAITIGSIGLAQHPEKQKKLDLIREFDATHYIQRDYPIEFPELHHVIEHDGQQIAVGDTTLTFFLAPGHSEDGLLTVVEPLSVLIAGDYLSDFELPFIYYSGSAYQQTLKKAGLIIDQYKIATLVPGHGQTTTNRQEMKRRVDMSLQYLRRLKQALENNDQEMVSVLEQEHAFTSAFTKECHQKNVEILLKELNE